MVCQGFIQVVPEVLIVLGIIGGVDVQYLEVGVPMPWDCGQDGSPWDYLVALDIV